MSESQYPKGSEWRKWDLHVHSPSSALNNQFPGATQEDKWTQYLEKLKGISDVAVLGITDYFSVDGYKEIITRGGLSNIDLIVPNVELRILPVTGAESCINFHIIFDPTVVEDLDSKFFSALEHQHAGETYRCTRADLIKLGRNFSGNQSLEENAAYREGVNQFKTDLRSVKAAFAKNAKLLNGAIVVVSNNSSDGNSGLQHSDSLTSTRQEIYRSAHCIFSSNPKDAEYFLGKGVDGADKVIADYGSLKPCIHGCDAHDLEGIGNPCAKRGAEGHTCKPDFSDCDQRFCWIKADPTFEGLRQIIYEPEERVRVQPQSPNEDRKKVVFQDFAVDGSTNFIIPDTKIPLNSELVTVIGGRGSGKSALLEAFAFLNEEHLRTDRNGKSKIIEYYRQNENAVDPAPSFLSKTALIDKDGNVQDFSKALSSTENLELPFLYIGQESLSGLATNEQELTKTICELIGVDVAELDQQELVLRAREVLAKVTNIRKARTDILSAYKESGFDGAVAFETWMVSYIGKIVAQQKRLSSNQTRTTLETINTKTQRGLKLKEFVAHLDEISDRLKALNINTSIETINAKITELYPGVATVTSINVSKQLDEIKIIKEKAEAEMGTLRKEIAEQKNELLKLGIKEDVNTLLQSTQTLQNQINKATNDLDSYKNSTEALTEALKHRNAILAKVEKSLQGLKDQIDAKFIEFKDSRSDSTVEERDLFKKVIAGIEVEGRVVFNEKYFIETSLERFIDGRRIKNENEFREEVSGRNADGSAKKITLSSIASWIQQDLSKKNIFNKDGVEGILEYVFTEWPDFVQVTTVVRLNGKPTEALSIGQRGTLLLKVFLATATAKQVFIIDQPEDNLDNAFIMNELVPLIREAKKSRQIIMSTHNANLVVNADAEQVVVAQLDQQVPRYISGGIENPEINTLIRDILEGGEIAFKHREQKYQI